MKNVAGRPAKKDLLVIDIADNSRVHRLPGLYSLFNLPPTMNLNGGNALEVERDIERLNRTQPWIDTSRISTPQDLKLAAERIEFFNFEPPPEMRGYTRNTWHAVPAGYRLALPEGRMDPDRTQSSRRLGYPTFRGTGKREITESRHESGRGGCIRRPICRPLSSRRAATGGTFGPLAERTPQQQTKTETTGPLPNSFGSVGNSA
jgi:hypothetical protein